MTTTYTAGRFQAFDANGDPLSGGKLFTYLAGSTTPQATYTSASLATPNANPVILDAAGRAQVWLTAGVAYRMVLKTSADVTVTDDDNIEPDTTDGALVSYLPAGTGAVETTVKAGLDAVGLPSIYRWLTAAEIADAQAGTAALDLRAKLQASQDADVGPIYLPAGVYGVSAEVVIKDGAGFVGQNAFWRTRSGYTYDPTLHSVIKYTGASGTNTCVVRASNPAVGVLGTDFNSAGDGVTDDLTSVRLENFTIDANGLADFGLYLYRAGNQSNIGAVTAMRAVKYNHVHMGCYAARYGHFGAYGAIGHGVAIGWDIFGWASVESTNFAYEASFHTVGNGTGATYVKGTATDLENSGGLFSLGRGSHVKIVSEGNIGRSCLISQYNVGGATAGPSTYELTYLEGSGDGPYVDYRTSMDSMRLTGGYIHPGNGASLQPQDITIEAKTNAGVVTTDEGPTDPTLYLVLDGLTGESTIPTAFKVKSNTVKYTMRGCAKNIDFSNRSPDIDDFVPTDAQITTGVYFEALAVPVVYHSKNGTLTRTGVGSYTFTFAAPFRVAGTQIPHLNIVESATLDTRVRINNITVGAAAIRTYNGAGVLADTGDRIAFSITGALVY